MSMNDLEQMAIERLKAASEMSLAAYQQPLVICISGGKDSGVITELAVRSGIPCEFQHNHTTADAPETVRFVRSEFKRLEEKGYKCTVNMPTYKGQRVSMWSLIPQKLMPPTRLVRYCCAVLKERGGAGRFICTGVRWAESASRKNNRGIYEKLGATKDKNIILANDNDEKRMLFENCRLKAKRVVNPIIDWTDKDVYGFLEDAKVPMNPLYAEGQCRVGCIGCPWLAEKAGKPSSPGGRSTKISICVRSIGCWRNADGGTRNRLGLPKIGLPQKMCSAGGWSTMCYRGRQVWRIFSEQSENVRLFQAGGGIKENRKEMGNEK